MLTGHFFTYSWTESTDNYCCAHIKLNPVHDIYKGHFPEMPVTPGVCQVQIVTEVLSACCKKKCVLSKAKDIKFLQLINPMEQNEFDLRIDISGFTDDQIDVKVLMTAAEKNVLKMRATYQIVESL